MTASAQIESLRLQLQRFASSLRVQNLLQERISLGLFGGSLGLNLLGLALVSMRVRPVSYEVPVHYSSLSPGGFDRLGPWYTMYGFTVVSLLLTVLNVFLFLLIAPRSRMGAFSLSAGSLVVAVFSLVIANAFTVTS